MHGAEAVTAALRRQSNGSHVVPGVTDDEPRDSRAYLRDGSRYGWRI